MSKSNLLRTFLLGLAFTTALPGQVDAREIIRRAVAADELNWKAARKYTFLQRVELRWLDAQGKVTLSHVQTYDVTLQEGTPYRQLVQREDSALSPSEEKAEHERLAKSIAERRNETDVKRARRLSEYDRRPDWQSDAWHELPEAFEFRVAGEGEIHSRSVIIIEAVPREGYQPRSRTARLFRSIKGKCADTNPKARHRAVSIRQGKFSMSSGVPYVTEGDPAGAFPI